MSIPLLSGLIALVLCLVFLMYLRLRTRHVGAALWYTEQFSTLMRELAEAEIPDSKKRTLDRINEAVGTGFIARVLLGHLASGKLDSPITREKVENARADWSGVSKALRIKFTQAIFTAMLADSYYGGLPGFIFRRAFFYARGNSEDLARSVDAYETKVLLVGADRAASSRLSNSEAPEDRKLVKT